MNKNIIVTGAAGFIGSCLASELSQNAEFRIIAVDDFSRDDKNKNLEGKHIAEKIDRTVFFEWLEKEKPSIDIIFHLGARTDTTEFDYAIFEELNISYSKKIWEYCRETDTPLVYASSAATYGAGELGYKDDEGIISLLKPLNPYGESKNSFDIWALKEAGEGRKPPRWFGLKFFNVYGPNEYHKERMASVILHAFRQIRKTDKMRLFRSHNDAYKNGEQLRDFVYVKDVISVCRFLHELSGAHSGIYNLGTGNARTFLDLTRNTFKAMSLEPVIEFIDTPEDIRDTYQYFTEADMDKLRAAGYNKTFMTLEEGVKDYVQNYLLEGKYF